MFIATMIGTGFGAPEERHIRLSCLSSGIQKSCYCMLPGQDSLK